MLGDKKLVSDEHFIFYNNLTSPDGALVHTGDNLTGEGDGDDEAINVDLSIVSPVVSELCIVVTIHEAEVCISVKVPPLFRAKLATNLITG
jgi:tellurium resistance protein TerD